jgi:hydroxypyruvate isomerase
MLKICPLIDLFFTDDDLATRAAKIADCGYSCVETWKGADPNELKQMNNAGIQLASIVMNFATDAPVAPINPDNRKRFLEKMDAMADSALQAGCRQGIVTAGQSVEGLSYQTQRATLVENLAAAGDMLAKRGFTICLEPLNTEVDHPGYFLPSPVEGVAIVKEVGLKNVKMLYDVYHMTIMTGNQFEFITRNLQWIGHFHVAGVPGRHEPRQGETNYPFLLRGIEQGGYAGCIGLEYFPLLESRASLLQTREYFSQI